MEQALEQQGEGELVREYARAWALAPAGLARVTWSFFSALTMSPVLHLKQPSLLPHSRQAGAIPALI